MTKAPWPSRNARCKHYVQSNLTHAMKNKSVNMVSMGESSCIMRTQTEPYQAGTEDDEPLSLTSEPLHKCDIINHFEKTQLLLLLCRNALILTG